MGKGTATISLQRVLARGELLGVRLPFYGWAIAAVGFVVTFCSGVGQTYVFAVFVDPIIEDTGLSRTTVSSLFTIGTVMSALTVVLIGRLVDRFGGRSMLVLTALGTGAACLSMSSASGLAALAISFTALRVIGQGALPTTSTLLLNQWFVRFRGRAVALASLGIAISSGVLPPLVRWLVSEFGWRGAYLALGVMVWLALVPLTLVIVRDRPEAIGLLPDGAGEPPLAERALPAFEPSRPRRSVVATSNFWLLAFPIIGPSFCINALVFHQISVFAERGLSATIAAAAFVPSAVAAAGGMLLVGFGVDRGALRALNYVCLGVLVLALATVQIMDTTLMSMIYSVLVGVSGGMLPVLSGVTWAHYYGRRGLGRIQGPAMMVHIGSAALGPLTVAALQQWWGSYQAAYLLLSGILAVGLIVTAGFRPRASGDTASLG